MAGKNSTRSALTEITIQALKPKASRYEVRDDKHIGLILRVSPATKKSPKGRKTWSLSYRNAHGKQQRYTIGIWPNVKLDRARKLASAKLGEVAGGTDIQAEKKEERRQKEIPTLGAFCGEGGEYRQWLEANFKSANKTLHRLTSVLPWQKVTLDKITHKKVEGWQTRRINSGISPWTVKRDIAPLRRLFRKAVEWGYLDENPIEHLKEPAADDNAVTDAYLDGDQEARLLAALRDKSTPEYLCVIVTVAMNTGMRRGELLKLDWSAVSLKPGSRRVTVTAKTAKGKKTRIIPLNRKAAVMLRWWRLKTGGEGAVFGLTDIKKSWATLLKLADIEDFRFHDLRHHFASRLVMAGIDLNTVRELLGHGDIRMTLRYAHLAPEHKAAAVEVL